MKLSVPYNHKPALLDALREIADRLAYIYLPFHPDVALSARIFSGATSIRGYSAELRRVAGFCTETGIGMNLVANAPAWAVDAAAVVRTAKRIQDQVPRLKVTFADLLAAREVHRQAPGIEIAVSCLADVQTPVQALWWREQAGAQHLTVSRAVNRQPDRLKALAGTGLNLSMVAFDECVPGCQVLGRHFQPAAGKGRLGTFVGACDPGNIEVRLKRPWLLAQKEVLPGHLRHLEGIIPEVKVSGRDQDTGEVLRRVRLYLEAESLTHPNGYYTEPPEAWAYLAKCDRNCPDCTWCREHLQLHSDAERTARSSATQRADWKASFVTPGGGRVQLWIQPVQSDRPPLRTVGGRGIYYTSRGAVGENEIESLVDHVAGLLEKKPFRSRTLDTALKQSLLPAGFSLAGGNADE
jgi:hypothetical protein